jgi:diketogulonate reductase-like aldo/keto reductase
VSNVESVAILARLYADAHIKPRALQNALWERSHFDAPLRAFCQATGISYQGYRLIASNSMAIRSGAVARVAQRNRVSAEAAWFAAVRALGVVPLTGSTSGAHLQVALDGVATRATVAETIELQRSIEAAFSG